MSLMKSDKHKWILREGPWAPTYRCGNCGGIVGTRYKFCPHCGLKKSNPEILKGVKNER